MHNYLGGYPLDKVGCQVPEWIDRPFRLVSLFDLMERINAAWVYEIARSLERATLSAPDATVLVTDASKPKERTSLTHISDGCGVLGLHVTEKYISTMLGAIEKPHITYGQFGEMVSSLHAILEHELQSTLFLHVASDDARHYQQKAAFGQKANDNFVSASFDIEEASNCLALGRSTACVMHLARVIEVGLKAVRTALGLPPPALGKQANWGDVLRQVWDEIGARNKIADIAWIAKQKPFFENVHSDISSVKNAWRNPSMHAGAMYDSERAEDIFNMTKSFMRHLAEHLDESGNFTP